MRVFNTLKWAALPLTVSLAGCSLFGGAVDAPPATLLAYISMRALDKIAVVSLIQHSPDGEPIPAGSAPANMAINPRSDREYLYVANSNTNTVTFVNVRTRQKEVPVSAGEQPWDVAITPDGRYLYVTNIGSKTVSMIDTESRAQVKEFTFESSAYPNFSPRGVATHPVTTSYPNKNEAYIISEGKTDQGGQIAVLRGNTTVKTYRVNTAGRMWKGAVTADGSRLLVTDREQAHLWAVDLSTGATQGISLPSPAWDVVVSPNTQKPAAFVSMPDIQSVAAIDLSTLQALTPQSVVPQNAENKPRQPQALAMNSAGTELWAALYGSNEVVRFPFIDGTNITVGPRLVNYSYTPGQTGAPEDIVLGRGVQ